MKWGAHEVDGRVAAQNAVKIRAALRQSIDAKQLFDDYQLSQPHASGNMTQDRARARAWAIMNIRFNNDPLAAALIRLWAEAWVLGDDAAGEALFEGRQAMKAVEGSVDWSKWKAGDKVTALMLRKPKAFQKILDDMGISLKNMDKTSMDRIGTALADSIELGLSPTSAAKLINNAVGNPARALTIAITETSRVLNSAAISRYKDAGVESMKWMTVLAVAGGSVACEVCAPNNGVVVKVGDSFPSGNMQPPAHPHCRCALLPDFSEYAAPNPSGVVDIAPATSAQTMPYSLNPTKMSETFDNRFGVLPEGRRQMAEDVLKQSYAEVAEQTLRVNLSPDSLELVTLDGRFKSVFEKTTYSEYMETRMEVETAAMGIPKTIAAAERPIYGSLAGNADVYGKIEVRLADTVKNRATMTLGDSFMQQNPVSVKKVLSGNATLDDLAQASSKLSTNGTAGRGGLFNPLLKNQDVEFDNLLDTFKTSQHYWEVQIHGGVQLSDIESVILPKLPAGTAGAHKGFTVGADGKWSGPLIDRLQAMGVKVVQP